MSDFPPIIPDTIQQEHNAPSWWTSSTEWLASYQFVLGAALGVVVGGVTASLIRCRK